MIVPDEPEKGDYYPTRHTERLKQKRATQPLAASAGCVWGGPTIDDAERLIEMAGRVHRAEISPKHANFIVNRGGASAADVRALMDMVQERVAARFGIALVPKIRIIGE
jgi:UDP-N-acetylmuramate dehydrogenase